MIKRYKGTIWDWECWVRAENAGLARNAVARKYKDETPEGSRLRIIEILPHVSIEQEIRPKNHTKPPWLK